jgi:hypothetical protein
MVTQDVIEPALHERLFFVATDDHVDDLLGRLLQIIRAGDRKSTVD